MVGCLALYSLLARCGVIAISFPYKSFIHHFTLLCTFFANTPSDTFTQNLSYCCYAFSPLVIYKGHPGLEQKRLWLLPYITYESKDHIFLMVWSSIFLVLWVLGTPVLMALFIWKGGRALPSYLQGASTRFIKAHYRYV